MNSMSLNNFTYVRVLNLEGYKQKMLTQIISNSDVMDGFTFTSILKFFIFLK